MSGRVHLRSFLLHFSRDRRRHSERLLHTRVVLRKSEFKLNGPRPVYPAATVHPDARRSRDRRCAAHPRGYTLVLQDHFDEVVVRLREVVGQRCAGFDLIPVRT
jgi:hypothetical protein